MYRRICFYFICLVIFGLNNAYGQNYLLREGTSLLGWKSITGATQIMERNIQRQVWEVFTAEQQTLGFIKFAPVSELMRTQQLDQLVTTYKLKEQFGLLNIEYPVVLPVDWENMPVNVKNSILSQRKNKKTVPVIMTAVDARGICMADIFRWLEEDVNKTYLRNQPITDKEWRQIADFYRFLNQHGFVHTDIEHNLYIKRAEDGKLQITLLDFELTQGLPDEEVLEGFRKSLQAVGGMEK